MQELDWRAQSDPAAVVQALAAHRLLPVAGMLAERGLLRADLIGLAASLVARDAQTEQRRAAIECEVAQAMASAEVPFLVLKGALLGRTVYASPETRLRTDLDLLVPEPEVEAAQAALRSLGFAPSWEVHGGPPMTQAQWIRRGERPIHAVDLHWDLFNRPLLKHRFSFEALSARAISLPGMGADVQGLSLPDALVHACAHYFGHHRGEFRPDQWLLDMDLLWRAMGGEARSEAEALARDCGVLSLLAAGLQSAAARFDTPVDEALLLRLEGEGARESSARLLKPLRFAPLEILRSAMDERGVLAKAGHLRRLAFPPAAYMRRKYPDAPRWALPWLYLRRAWEGIRR